jgi:hypothetical protein
LLSVEGQLFAWQKLAATEAGTFRIVAEFFDSALALRAVQRLNGKEIQARDASGEFQNITVSVTMHSPDIPAPPQPHRLAPMATPTRRSSDQSELGDVLGRMSLNHSQNPGFPGHAELYSAAISGSSALSYMAANAASFALSPNSAPVMMGSMYAPAHIAYQQGFSSGVPPQAHLGGNNFNDFTPAAYSQQAFVHNGFDQRGFNQPSFQHHVYGQGFSYSGPHSASQSRDIDYFNRPSGRRQNAVKVPQQSMRGRQFPNPAAGHHNHVDIHRIKQGIDVRTTVSPLSTSFRHCKAYSISGYAPQHPQQG